jgi:carbon monoxide dehydrogenase subunit G
VPTFAQRILSSDRIEAAPEPLRDVLGSPALLAELTPLVQGIEVAGDRWRWQLVGITALGISAAPAFTTVMAVEPTRIAFRPDPSRPERASATGHISVEPDGPDHTVVAIDLTATVDLRLPSVAARAVRSVMYSTMRAGGARFADNLLAHLGDPPHRGLDVRPGPTPGPAVTGRGGSGRRRAG